MFLLSLALAASISPAPSAPSALAAGDHGKLAWFEGTFEAALAKARAEKKIVFLDFWTSW